MHLLTGAATGFFHDMAVTEHYYVFLQNPIKIDLWRMLTGYTRGHASLAECLKFDPKQQTKLILVPRPGRGVGSEVGVERENCWCNGWGEYGCIYGEGSYSEPG